jgi:hypothetical protein
MVRIILWAVGIIEFIGAIVMVGAIKGAEPDPDEVFFAPLEEELKK